MSEQQYDDEISPALLKIVERCKDLGMTMVCMVEYEPGNTEITQHVPKDASVQMKMAQLAMHSHGNFDKLAMSFIREFPQATDQCIALHHLKPSI